MRALSLVVILVSLLLAGCASSGDVIALVPIVGGGKLRVPLERGSASLVKTAEVEIVTAGFELQPEAHTLTYQFEFRLRTPAALRCVTIEDVAGEQATRLVDDFAPKLLGQNWRGVSPTLPADDHRLAWLYTVENSIRVYRFTLETGDGRKIVLDQAFVLPALAKGQVRHGLGANY